MANEKTDKKPFKSLAEDLRKTRARKPSQEQIEELNSILDEPIKKSGDVKKKKSALPRETEV